ncbi:hypothetical protein C2R22_21175 (plasmid) [Salinigranum rubrum]|uniref:RCK N-terminal domain-containing protein n=1 Tax=Salinigranum rubrum TaxID=755307 RepID=A0A2I8VQD4_9EURY|nr:hypothetical protein C2R22_21175 [Salinigranum rubrum]
MNVVIVGVGEVGSTIAELLSKSHDVTVIDVDPQRVDTLTYDLDVLAIRGDGTDVETLRDAKFLPCVRAQSICGVKSDCLHPS